MLFQDVVGQKSVKESLLRSVHNGRISHAQLFLGPQGCGNLAAAVAYSRFILCSNQQAEDACGECHSCKMVNKLAHPDLHFSFPVILSSKVSVSDHLIEPWRKALLQQPYLTTNWWYSFLSEEKKQGVIGTKESEEIVRKLSLKSYEGGFKIVIIWMPELLNGSASNKLLKIIEEPPPKTLFILVANDHEKLLPTVLSRTQLIKFKRLPEEVISEALVQRKQVDVAQAASVSRLADGSYFEAVELLDRGKEGTEYFDSFSKWMRLCFQRDVKGAVHFSDEVAAMGREKQKRILRYGLHIFRESIVSNYVGDDALKMIGEEMEFTLRFAPYVKSDNMLELCAIFSDAHAHVERNANAKIVFLDVSFKVFRLLKR